MKKLKIMFTMLVLLGITVFSNKVFALTSSDLISVGSGSYAITVTVNTTIDQISAVLGEPKLTTDSVFGGKAYTFYTDSDYSNFLYIETNSSGEIISYGSVDPTYKTRTYSYGSDYPFRDYTALHGYLVDNDDGVVVAGIYYNRNALLNGSVSQTIEKFKETYMSNPVYYLKCISEQGVTMYNALSTKLGNKTELVFDEDFFYINEQFKEWDSSIEDYLSDMGKSSTEYLKALKTTGNIEITTSIYWMFNPMMFAMFATDNTSAVFGDKNIAIFDYNYETKVIQGIAVSKNVFDKKNLLSLTEDELAKLSAGRAEYESAITNLNLESGLYDVVPRATNASTLVAGELKQSKKEGITDYINAIRVAAGLPKLKIDEDAFTVAQHIATLTSYRIVQLGEDLMHMPSQPDGVSDYFYSIAIGKIDGNPSSASKGYGENLGYSASESTVAMMMRHINMFLDDRSEKTQNFSHREKILNPKFTSWGYGISPYTFSNEFSGAKKSDVFLEAWPAEGITFLESLEDNKFFWTAQFLDKYKVTDTTTVKVTCLNTNDTWSFTELENTTNRRFQRYTKALTSINNKVVFYDSTIYPEYGHIYEITINNLTDEDTGATTSYTYRAVFEYADVDSYPTTATNISISAPSDIKKVTDADKDIYYIPVGEEVKFDANIDASVTDKKITWISSSDKVKVTQNGTVFASSLLDEDATIAIIYDGTNITDQIIVRPYNKIEQVKLEPSATSIDKGDSGEIQVTYLPEDATEETEITWKVVSCTDESVEYDIDDSYITKYIKVEKVEGTDLQVKVTAVDAEMDNNMYKVVAHVQGISGEYTGTCNIEVNVPLLGMNVKGGKFSYETKGEGLPRSTTVNYNEYYEKYGTNMFELEVEYIPKNTTVDKNVTWEVEDSSIISKYIDEGTFRIDKEGETKIYAVHGKGTNAEVKAELDINITSDLESIDIQGTTKTIKLESNGIGYTANDKLTTTRYPEIDTDVITYTSSNENIATVDENGKVKFKGTTGSVTITATSGKISDTYTYDVIIPITSIQLPNVASTTQTIKKGEVIQNEVVYYPSIATLKNYITYTSSNPSVATVNSSNGQVVGKSAGTTVITASVPAEYTSTGSTYSVSYTVSVIIPVESISTDEKLTLNIEEGTYTPSLTISPSNYADKVLVNWNSSNTDVLKVDSSSGKMTPISSGRVNVTVTVVAINSAGQTVFTKNISVLVKSVNDPEYLKGDLDRNGVVNANDAAVALDLYKYENATDEDILIGDIDENGVINANDAALILDIYKYGE